MWQGWASVVPWNWEKCSCCSKLVPTLSVLPLSALSWRVFQPWSPCQIQQSISTWSLWLFQASVCLLWSPCWCLWDSTQVYWKTKKHIICYHLYHILLRRRQYLIHGFITGTLYAHVDHGVGQGTAHVELQWQVVHTLHTQQQNGSWVGIQTTNCCKLPFATCVRVSVEESKALSLFRSQIQLAERCDTDCTGIWEWGQQGSHRFPVMDN